MSKRRWSGVGGSRCGEGRARRSKVRRGKEGPAFSEIIVLAISVSRRHKTRFICRVYCRWVRPTAFYGCFSKERCHPVDLSRHPPLQFSISLLSFPFRPTHPLARSLIPYLEHTAWRGWAAVKSPEPKGWGFLINAVCPCRWLQLFRCLIVLVPCAVSSMSPCLHASMSPRIHLHLHLFLLLSSHSTH